MPTETRKTKTVTVTGDSNDVSVYLYVPNVMDYMRIFLLLVALWYMKTNFVITSLCYIFASFLDGLDGTAARSLNQKSNFGAVLDTVIDRTSIAAFKIGLAQFYPDWTFWIQVDVIIDIGGHWMYTWMALLRGERSHKVTDLTRNPILKLYYSSRVFLYTLVAASESFWVLLYVLHFSEGPILISKIGVWRLLAYTCAPLAIFKVLITLMHIKTASRNIVEIDSKEKEGKITRRTTTVTRTTTVRNNNSPYDLRSHCHNAQHKEDKHE